MKALEAYKKLEPDPLVHDAVKKYFRGDMPEGKWRRID